MQKWKHKLKRGVVLTLSAIVIGSGINIMTMPVSAENETTNAVEKKEQVGFHFPKSEVTVVEKDPDFTMAAEGAAEGSVVTYSIDQDRVATVDNNGTVHIKQEGIAVITAIASETDEYKSKEISYELHALGYCLPDVEDAIIDDSVNSEYNVSLPEISIKDPEILFKDDKVEDIIKKDIEETEIKEVKSDEWKVKNVEDKYELSVLEFTNEVPKVLKANYEEVAQIKEDMIKKMRSEVKYVSIAVEFVIDPIVFDVKLMTQDESGKNVEVTPENFPEEGVTVSVPYPEGSDKDKHEFVVSHMFTHEMNGYKPGEIECPKVTKGEHGLTFTVKGFSPISIGWYEAKSSGKNGPSSTPTRTSPSISKNDVNTDGNKTNANNIEATNQERSDNPAVSENETENVSANRAASNISATSSSPRSPKTADNNSIILYLIVMFGSIIGLVGVRKYKYCK